MRPAERGAGGVASGRHGRRHPRRAVVGWCKLKPVLQAPGLIQRLKVKYDELLSSFAFNCSLRLYTVGARQPGAAGGGAWQILPNTSFNAL